MRIGIAGVGRIGIMHARNVSATPGVTEVILLDAVPGRAAEVAAELGVASGVAVAVRAVEDLPALLAAGPDGLLVTTPTPQHAEVVRTALAARVPVLVEKPLAGDLATIRDLIREVEASGVPVLVGFQRRFDPGIAELKQRIAGGAIGDLYVVRAVAFDATPPPAEYIPTSGGIFRDLFVHDLDCVPWLVGQDVVEVHATGSVLVDRSFADADDVDTATITLRFASGVLATITGGRRDGGGYDNRIEAIGSAQALAAGLDPRTPITSLEPGGHNPAGNAYPGFVERYATAYAREVAVFLDVITGRAENPSPVGDSLVSLVLADACEQSRRTGLPVAIDSAALRA